MQINPRHLFPTRAEWILARDAGEGAPLPDRAGPDHPTAPLRHFLLACLRGDVLGPAALKAPDAEAFAAWLDALDGGGWGYDQDGGLCVTVILPRATLTYITRHAASGANIDALRPLLPTVKAQLEPGGAMVDAGLRVGIRGPGLSGAPCTLIVQGARAVDRGTGREYPATAEIKLSAAWRIVA